MTQTRITDKQMRNLKTVADTLRETWPIAGLHLGELYETLNADRARPAPEPTVREGDGEAREILASLVKTVENMRVPQTTADAALQILVVGPSLQRAQAFLAAPHPTPAPASGEVTDAAIMHVLEHTAWVERDNDVQHDELFELVKRCFAEAATRARQGEGEK